MRFDLKVILIGGIAFYVALFIVGMPFGALIHEGVLDEVYRATASFWRPELNEEPADIGALMPRWITVGIIVAFVQVFIYDNVRSALSGSPVMNGLKFGLILALLGISTNAAFSGIFNLPNEVWMWWSIEHTVLYLIGGAVLGFVVNKLRPAAG